MGTWCGDSQEQVPRFYRVLDEAKIDCKSMKVICVNGQKQCSDVQFEDYNIERVPTFIFYRKDKEIGRIIESPEVSLEEDFWGIIK